MMQYLEQRGMLTKLHPLEQLLIAGLPVICASEPGRLKHESLVRELRKSEHLYSSEVQLSLVAQLEKMIPEVIFEAPEIEEDQVKKESFVNQSDKRIAVLKAHRGQKAEMYRQHRKRRNLATQLGLVEWLGGSLEMSYANDVMTSVMLDGKEWKEFKPDKESTKEDIFRYLQLTIGTAHPGDNRQIQALWYSSLSVHEAKTDIQVVRQDVNELVLRRASDEFLNALIYGIYDPKHPVKDLVAWQFMNLYVKGTAYSNPNSHEKPDRHKKNWGGWTPEAGMTLESLRKVNAGKKGDSIPFIEFLVESVNGIDKGDPRFEVEISDAIKAVRGKPRNLQYVLRRLIETIGENATPAKLDRFKGSPEFIDVANQIRSEQADGKLPAHWNYTGRTVDISGELEPIQPEIYIPFILALLGMREDSTTSGIIS